MRVERSSDTVRTRRIKGRSRREKGEGREREGRREGKRNLLSEIGRTGGGPLSKDLKVYNTNNT